MPVLTMETHADQSAASILQSVKEQEAQFEALTRELEAERQSVANQLERCKFGSETASMSSISSTDESFKWRPPPKDYNIDEESDADSKISGSQLVDSCLRVLQERGLMGKVGEDPSEYLPYQPPSGGDTSSSLLDTTSTSNVYNVKTSTIVNNNTMMNGPASPAGGGYGGYSTGSQHVTITKTVTTKVSAGHDSPSVGQDSFYSTNAAPPDSRSPPLEPPSPRMTPSYSHLQQSPYNGGDSYSLNDSSRALGREFDDESGYDNRGYHGSQNVVANDDGRFNDSRYNGAGDGYNNNGDRLKNYDNSRGGYGQDSASYNNYDDPYRSNHGDEDTSFGVDRRGNQDDSYNESSLRGPPPEAYRLPASLYRDEPDSSLDPRGQQGHDPAYHSLDYSGGGDPGDPGYQRLADATQQRRLIEDDDDDPAYPASNPSANFNGQPGNNHYGDYPSYGGQQYYPEDNRYGNHPDEDPYGSQRSTPRPQENPYGSRQQPEPENPYGTRPNPPQMEGVYGGPEDPYGSRPPPQEDPYGHHGYPPQGPDDRSQSPGNSSQGNRGYAPQQPPYVPSPRPSYDPDPYDPNARQTPPYDDRDRGDYSSSYRGDDPYSRGSPRPSDPPGSQQGGYPPYDQGYPPRGEEDSGYPPRLQQDDPDYAGSLQGGPQDDPYGSQSRLRPPYAGSDAAAPSPRGLDGSKQRLDGSRQRLDGSTSGSQRGLGGSHSGSQPRMAVPYYEGEDVVDEVTPQFASAQMMPRTTSVNSVNRDMRYRDPNLPEVIEFLSHPNDSIKANAAAYLQHLCYMNDRTKTETRDLGGIPALVDLVNNEIPEVHRAACGALRNLSYGRQNTENKVAIKNAGGIPALVRLLRRSPDTDVRELVTGILWNLSSCPALKKPIIDDGLSTIVDTVIIPHSGWDPSVTNQRPPTDIYWSTVFRNASGILRNISSDGEYARRKLRACRGLPDSILFIVQAAIGKNDIDNKSVENCVCLLRNLSYACQEVEDSHYLDKRDEAVKKQAKGEATGCFGGSSSSKSSKDKKKDSKNKNGAVPNTDKPVPMPSEGAGKLWHPSVVGVYLPLLTDCTNPETLEAAAGAIQNLAACDWKPSEDIRAAVRKDKGLPVMVELLNLEADRVVCAAATALRNLALDKRNKELIGKYAMKQLVCKLPSEHPSPNDFPMSDDTICAVECTLYEVIRRHQEFANTLFNEKGVDRLIYITNSTGKFTSKVVKFASQLLHTMWGFKELHSLYKQAGYTEKHFMPRTMSAKPSSSTTSSAVNTLDRPRMDQSGPTVAGVNEHTLPHITRQPVTPTTVTGGYMMDDRSYGGSQQRLQQGEDIPLQPLSGGSHHGSSHNVVANPNYYGPGSRQPDTADTYPNPSYDPYGSKPQQDYPDNYSQQGGGGGQFDQYSQQGGQYSDQYSQQGGQYSDHYAPSSQQYAPSDQYSQQGYGDQYGGPAPGGDQSFDGGRSDTYRPAGAVPVFPGAQPSPREEPIYSKPNKIRRNPGDMMTLDPAGGGAPPQGADSWV